MSHNVQSRPASVHLDSSGVSPLRIATCPGHEGIEVVLTFSPGRATPVRVDLHRTGVVGDPSDIDRMGPPISHARLPNPSAPWQSSTTPDGSLCLRFLDTDAPSNWVPQWYTAIAWFGDGPSGARTSASSLGARPATTAPQLADISTARVGAHVLLRWSSNLPREPSPLGRSCFSVTGRSGEVVVKRRSRSEHVPLIVGCLPPPCVAPMMFVHDDAASGEPPHYCAYLELSSPADIVIAASDPMDRTVTASVRHERP